MARQSKAASRAKKRAELERQRHEATRKRKIRNGLVGGAVVGVLALVAVLTWPSVDPAVAVADAASVISQQGWDLPELDGEGRVRIADFSGKPTVAVFFANWCEICEEEIPELADLSQVIGDEVNFVGINIMDNARGLSDAKRWGIAGVWPLARDVGNGNNSLLAVEAFGARGSPLHVIYDANGRVVFIRNSAMRPSEVVQVLTNEGLL